MWRSFVLHSSVLIVLLSCFVASGENVKSEQHRMEQILNLVARDVRENFYDSNLKGLDWNALTEQARDRIRKATEAGQMSGAISALVYSLHDSHTAFIPPKRNFRLKYGFEAKPFGNNILVYKVEKNGPAATAGLQLGDQIVGVNGLNATPKAFFDMMQYLTVLDPREELDVEVADHGSSRVVKIPATVVHMPPQYFFQFIETGQDERAPEPFYTVNDYHDGIEYLRVRTFVFPETAMVGMTKPLRNAKAVILDLRGNAGGLTEAMTDLLGHFIGQPLEIAEAVSRKKSDPVRVKPDSLQIACPLFVLVDSASASASEMFARSVQIHKRATVLGDRTSGSLNLARFFWEPPGQFYGRGSWEAVEFGTEIAVARIVMEDGEELEGRGITPDEICIPSAPDLHGEKDPCLDRALALARKAAGQSNSVAKSQ